MPIAQVLGWFARRDPTPRLIDEDFLLSQHQFRSALRRERLQCDRKLSGFSLLTLTPGQRTADYAAYAALVDAIKPRVRETDTAGWFAKPTVGILLPDTPAGGAWKLAGALRRLLDEREVSARFEVYTYHSVDSPDEQLAGKAAKSDAGLSASSQTVRSLEMLFVEKLPALKRLIDIVVASIGLAVASPAMLVVALAIKVTSRGPVFYCQRRDGWGGRKFWIYKFRTMVVNAEAIKAQFQAQSEQDGPAFKLKNDPRVTSVGRLLRRTCIDELPQFFNVLKGDMSLVGPRPMCTNEARHCSQWQRRRLDVVPGLTCIWQVYGGTKVTFLEWMRMDLRYIRSRSLWHDLRLVALTVPAVIRRDGVY